MLWKRLDEIWCFGKVAVLSMKPFRKKKIVQLKIAHPEAEAIAHPECETSVLRHASYIGSTAGFTQILSRKPYQ